MPSSESSRVLKAADARGLGAKIAFNYDDLQRRCDEHIAAVRQQAQQLIRDAQAQAEAIRHGLYEDARQAGYREGLEQAAREIEQQIAARAEEQAARKLQAALPALQAAAEALGRERDRWLAEWETTAVRLSVAVAEKLIRRELAADPRLSLEMIAPALELAAGSPQIKVRLNPGDLALLGDQADEWVQSLSACGQAALAADPNVSAGSCLIETQHGLVDATLETQLARIAAELSGP